MHAFVLWFALAGCGQGQVAGCGQSSTPSVEPSTTSPASVATSSGDATESVTPAASDVSHPLEGIDVSHDQQKVNWDQVAHSGRSFACAKATQGRQTASALAASPTRRADGRSDPAGGEGKSASCARYLRRYGR